MTWRTWMENVALDFRFALRRLVKSPGFAVTASLSLALGIGANTAAFSVLYAVLLRGLPVRDPASLVLVQTRYSGTQYSMPHPAFIYLRDHASSLDGLSAFRDVRLNVSSDGSTERIPGMLVSGEYFKTLGVDMSIGSPIAPDDDRTPGSGGARGMVAVIGHRFWTRSFNSDERVVGRGIRVNGQPVTIVGVAPPSFNGTRVGSLPDIFLPMMFAPRVFDSPNWLTNPRNNWIRLIGRLKPHVSLSQGQADLTRVYRQFNEDVVAPLVTTDTARQRLRQGVIVLQQGRVGLMEMDNTVRPTLFALMALVGLVLIIACVNVASLMVARTERSHRESAICVALGATRARLRSRAFVETFLIGATGLAGALILASWMRTLLVQLMPANQDLDVAMDSRVLGVSIGLGMLSTVVLSTVAAWGSARLSVTRALKGADIAARLWLRKGLVIGQVALSVVVLVTAALFGETLSRLRQVDPGFAQTHILIASLAPDAYTRQARSLFYERLLDEVRRIPGVEAAALAGDEPLAVGTGWSILVRRGSEPPQQAGASIAFISPDYFRTMGIPLVRGRDFESQDRTNPSQPIIVNENFVRSYLDKDTDPIGSSITGNGTQRYEIVGVVKDSASMGLRDLDQHMIYVPSGGGVLHVRASLPPASLQTTVEATVHRLDPDVPVFNVRTIEQQLERFQGRERTFARLSSTFGLLALVLSAVGLYGVLANAVSRRTKELGIRLALGAAPRRIGQLVLREAGLLVAIGIAVGIPAAFLVGRAVEGLLFVVQPGDWRSMAAAVAVLIAVAGVAAGVPARRASCVDPLIALRSE
jgi:predicted permease